MRKVIFELSQSPGDVTVMTAAVRDLHRAHAGQFQTDVRTTAMELWENNPHITPIADGTPRGRANRDALAEHPYVETNGLGILSRPFRNTSKSDLGSASR